MKSNENITRWVTDIAGLRVLVWVMAAAWFLKEILAYPYHIGHAHDWAYFTHHAHSAFLTYVRFHQIPMWDPYYCGGIPVLGNLQDNAVAPSMIFPILFGLMPGLKIAWFAFFVAGMEGTFRYARHLGIRGAGAVAAALAFSFSGRFVQIFHDGHPVFLAFLLTPWAMLCLEKGFRSWRWTFAGSIVMTVIFLEGGAVPLPLISIFLFIWAACHSAALLVSREKDIPWYRPMITLTAMAVVTFGLSAFRFLPAVDTLVNNPRIWPGSDTYTVGHIINMLFFNKGREGYTGDGSTYIGRLTLAFFILAVFLREKKAFLLLAAMLVCLEMATGSKEYIGLFPALKKLPVFVNLRNPFRMTILMALLVALGAGCGISAIESRILEMKSAFDGRKDWHRAAISFILLFALVLPTASALYVIKDVSGYTRKRLAHVLTRPVARTMDQPFRQSIGNRWFAHVWPAASLGSISCFEEQAFFMSPGLRGDLKSEEYLADGGAGSARRRSWSPHRIEVDVDLERTATLVVNQNFHRAWRASTGSVTHAMGLLAVELPKGRRTVVLTFRDPLIELGVALSVLTLLAFLAVELGRWLHRRRSGRDRA
jgi:hypothetical protein